MAHFEYNSQWVFETMYGKENYLNYLSGKFKTLVFSPDAHPTAVLAYFKNYYQQRNKPCLILK